MVSVAKAPSIYDAKEEGRSREPWWEDRWRSHEKSTMLLHDASWRRKGVSVSVSCQGQVILANRWARTEYLRGGQMRTRRVRRPMTKPRKKHHAIAWCFVAEEGRERQCKLPGASYTSESVSTYEVLARRAKFEREKTDDSDKRKRLCRRYPFDIVSLGVLWELISELF